MSAAEVLAKASELAGELAQRYWHMKDSQELTALASAHRRRMSVMAHDVARVLKILLADLEAK